MIKDLQIISPTKAKEINPYKITEPWHYKRTESNLKEYTITGVMVHDILCSPDAIDKIMTIPQKVKCEVNEDNLTAIIL